MGALTFLCFFLDIFFLKVNHYLYIVCYLCEGRWWFQCVGYDYMACMDYMDPDVHCPQKALNFNHSLTACQRFLWPFPEHEPILTWF